MGVEADGETVPGEREGPCPSSAVASLGKGSSDPHCVTVLPGQGRPCLGFLPDTSWEGDTPGLSRKGLQL